MSTGPALPFERGSRIELPCLLASPGPALATALAGLPLADLTEGATIEVAAATQRLIRWAHGLQMCALAEYDRFQVWSGDPRKRDDPTGVRARNYGADELEAMSEFADREIACALGIAPVSAGAKLGMAQDLQERLSATRDAMLAGVLDEPKAKLIVTATRVLTASNAAMVEAQILPTADKLPYRRLKSELDRLVMAAEPESSAERHLRAREGRRCLATPTEDGMGWFSAELTADGMATVWNALDARAWAGRDLRGDADDRTLDQRRADALVDVCAESLDRSLAGHYRLPVGVAPTHAAIERVRTIVQRRCTVNVHMGADVVLGVSDNPVYLEGYGWVPAPVGRRLIGQNAVLRRVIDDPISGRTLNVSSRTYHPGAELATMARLRDQFCTFPMCNRPTSECQLDHTVPHPKGRAGPPKPGDRHATDLAGLGSLCDAEHRVKTMGGWRVHRLVDRWEWISPTGKVYTTTSVTYSPRSLAELAVARRHGLPDGHDLSSTASEPAPF